MDFENLTSEDLIKKPPKAVKKKATKPTGVPFKIGTSIVYLREDGVYSPNPNEKGKSIELDFPETVEGILELQQLYPNIITGIVPPLYSIFKSAIDGKLQPYVAVGDRVKYVKAIYMPSGVTINDEFTVTNVELSSLGNMSVFVAALDNGDTTVLTNFLKKV